jgi:hypothetical protein
MVQLKKMKAAVFPILLLALLLAAGNSLCAMNCSSQPCQDESSLPPCHQHQGHQSNNAGICLQTLPLANVAVVVHLTPALAVVDTTPELPVRWAELDPAGSLCQVGKFTPPLILRI